MSDGTLPAAMDTFPANTKEYVREIDLPQRKVRGWVHEVEIPMRAGDMIHYTAEHDEPGGRVDFNVHSHHGKEVTYHAKNSESSVSGTFSAPHEGKFYMMWENVSEAPVRVRIQASRHEVHSGPVAEGEGHGHG